MISYGTKDPDGPGGGLGRTAGLGGLQFRAGAPSPAS